MWYFTWILGVGVALSFGVVSALWYEARGEYPDSEGPSSARPVPSRAEN